MSNSVGEISIAVGSFVFPAKKVSISWWQYSLTYLCSSTSCLLTTRLTRRRRYTSQICLNQPFSLGYFFYCNDLLFLLFTKETILLEIHEKGNCNKIILLFRQSASIWSLKFPWNTPLLFFKLVISFAVVEKYHRNCTVDPW